MVALKVKELREHLQVFKDNFSPNMKTILSNIQVSRLV